jgi:hypothetical protein
MSREGGWDLVKGVRTSGPFHCQPYQCCNFTHSHIVITLRNYMALAISHNPLKGPPPALQPFHHAATRHTQLALHCLIPAAGMQMTRGMARLPSGYKVMSFLTCCTERLPVWTCVSSFIRPTPVHIETCTHARHAYRGICGELC